MASKKVSTRELKRRLKDAQEVEAAKIMALQKVANAEMSVVDRRPRVVAGRVFDLTVVESLANTGLTYDEIVRKLRLNKFALAENPQVDEEIRAACEAGSIDLIEEIKTDLRAHSKKNFIASIAILKASGCPEYQDKKVEKTDPAANAQELLFGFLSVHLASERAKQEETKRMLAEERMRAEGRSKGELPPVLGKNDPRTGKAVVISQVPITVTEKIDQMDQEKRMREYIESNSVNPEFGRDSVV
jgi:hypothetical protein